MTILTIAKLLRSASASACEPASQRFRRSRARAGDVRVRRSWSLARRIRRQIAEQIKRRRAFVENQRRLLVERLLQRVNAQQENRQLGILLEDRQRLGGLGLALGAQARRGGLRVGDGPGGLGIGGGLDFLRLRFARVFGEADEHLPLGFHAVKDVLGHVFGQADFFEAEKFKFHAVIVRPQFVLHGLFNFIFNLVELQRVGIRIDEIGQRMPADGGGFGRAQHALELALRVGQRHRRVAGENLEELAGVRNPPADINARQQHAAVGGERRLNLSSKFWTRWSYL